MQMKKVRVKFLHNFSALLNVDIEVWESASMFGWESFTENVIVSIPSHSFFY